MIVKEELSSLFSQFNFISLKEMKSVKLMNRVDTKFLTTKEFLPILLQQLISCYYIQKIDNQFFAHYKTLYFDTPDLQMYLAHHNKKLKRQKLRSRIYCNSNLAFCEIKNKNNKGKTQKNRVEIPDNQYDRLLSNDTAKSFIAQYLYYELDQLLPQVETEFDRLTFVNYEKTERLTVDMHLVFRNYSTHNESNMQDLVIIELKQNSCVTSRFKSIMNQLRIFPYRISKYCLGTVLTNYSVKRNRFKKKIRYIENLLTHNNPNNNV